MRVFTSPREIEPRWVRLRDQIAVFATSYDPEHLVTPVRTLELAALADDLDNANTLVVWRDIVSGPVLVAKRPGVQEITIAMRDGVTTLRLREREQVVIREALEVEPWDVPQLLACSRVLPDGSCYLPTGHRGGCDSDVVQGNQSAADVQADTAAERVDDMTALMDSVAE